MPQDGSNGGKNISHPKPLGTARFAISRCVVSSAVHTGCDWKPSLMTPPLKSRCFCPAPTATSTNGCGLTTELQEGVGIDASARSVHAQSDSRKSGFNVAYAGKA